ncbi:MAG: T9SS type A sorting domain-containing protein [Bacteroidia bacterium]|nr:T9SS type A sorting domain-containing protein [Bacteroidia bacterium]
MKKIILFITLCILLGWEQTNAQWQAFGSGLPGKVKAIAVFNNEIYAGGEFTSPSHIAKWTGSAWVAVGNGFNGDVNALAVHGGKLYAAGSFTADGSGATQLKYMAVLNSGSWTQAGQGLTNFANALYSDVSSGTLYVGGAFVPSGPFTANKIASFDGSTFSQVGNAPPNVVNAITKFSGSIYIGINSTISGQNLGRLNGSSWTYLTGLTWEVLALAPIGTKLYIGGKGTSSAAYLATTTGSTIGSPFNTVNGYVYALYSTPSKLFGGGAFTSSPSSGAQLKHCFQYNGNTPFGEIDGGMNGNVYSIANLNGRIIMGGSFSLAGTTPASNIAISTGTIGIDELSTLVEEVSLFPNPVSSTAVLEIGTTLPVQHPVLKIYDLQSRIIKEVPEPASVNHNKIKFIFNREGLDSGVYYYLVQDSEGKGLVSDRFIVE